MSGLAIEAATSHVEVLAVGPDGEPLARVVEEVSHGHVRRLTPIVHATLERAGLAPAGLTWLAASLGPGSFTGVRVGLATAKALALAADARVLGASTLASLAHAAPAAGARRAFIVPLVPAGRRDVYAGFFRADAKGDVRLVAAPRVIAADALGDAVEEIRALLPGATLRFVGPGAGREQARLEQRWPTSTALAFRHDGLSALDLAIAARKPGGPGAGLPGEGHETAPAYVRSAQAEETVRRQITARVPTTLRGATEADIATFVTIERRVFPDPWPESFFRSLLASELAHVRVAERDGGVAGYAMTVVQGEAADLENLAIVPEQRRCGIAAVLLDDALAESARRGARQMSLEVRVSNDAAQALYRGLGFRAAGLRRGYYRKPLEDALVMRRELHAHREAPQPSVASPRRLE